MSAVFLVFSCINKCKFINYIVGTLNLFIIISSSHSSWIELGISLGGVLIVK